MDIPNETTERILNMVCSNDKEEAIMRSILKFGFSISDIARKTKLPRTSLLYVLKKLQKRNLVRTIEDGDKIYWRACLEDVRRAFKKLDNISLTEVEVIKNVPGIINFLSSWPDRRHPARQIFQTSFEESRPKYPAQDQ